MNDWKSLEPLLVEDAVRALRALMDAHPQERFYAAALYGVYRELDGPISLPSLAANSLAALGGPRAGRFWDASWNPSDWRWDGVDFESNALRSAAEAAAREMQATHAGWRAGERRFFDMLVSAGKKIRKALGRAPQLAPGFIVFVHDDEGGTALVRRSTAWPSGSAPGGRGVPRSSGRRSETMTKECAGRRWHCLANGTMARAWGCSDTRPGA